MSNEESSPPWRRGMAWKPLTAGEPVGIPFAEWAYITPRHPGGIKGSALRFAAREVQKETALFWFFLNYRPYDLSGQPFFTFGVPGRGFGQAPFAPAPISAAEIIDPQFTDVLPDDLREELKRDLDGQWMIAPSGMSDAQVLDAISGFQSSKQPVADPGQDQGLAERLQEIETDLQAVLDLAEGTWSVIGVGHNRPPEPIDDSPVTPDEVRGGIQAVNVYRAELSKPVADDALVAACKDTLRSLATRLSNFARWLEGQSSEFIQVIQKNCGRITAETILRVGATAVVGAAAAKLWQIL
jgi:hypothetical protein